MDETTPEVGSELSGGLDRWVPCSERMPKQGQAVMVITVKHGKPLNRRLAEYWMPEPGVHDDDHAAFWDQYDEITATHWTPLLDPPAA